MRISKYTRASVFSLALFVTTIGSMAAAQTPPPTPTSGSGSTSGSQPPPVPAAPGGDAASPGQPSSFYYYCQKTKSYYPAVNHCDEGWIALPIAAPPMDSGYEHEGYENTIEESQEAVIGRPNMVTLEFLGRSLVYSLNYDRRITEHWTFGLGISTWQATVRWANYQASVTVVPVYANYYFSELPSRGFITAGLDIIQNSNPGFDSSTFANNGGAAVIGGGYEMRDPSGFTIRLGGDLIFGRSVIINPSMSVGIAF